MNRLHAKFLSVIVSIFGLCCAPQTEARENELFPGAAIGKITEVNRTPGYYYDASGRKKQLPETVKFIGENGVLTITPYGDCIIRVCKMPVGGDVDYRQTQAVTLNPADSSSEAMNVTAKPDCYIIEKGENIVKVNRKTGQVSFYDAETQSLLLEENDGIDNREAIKHISFRNKATDNFYGAGERGHSLKLNGDTLVMYNRQNYGYTADDARINQMNITVPYLLSDAGWSVLFDDFCKASLTLGSETIEYDSESPAPIAYYFINGGDVAGNVEQYTALTGRQSLPPFWTMGYITSKYGYKTQQETLSVIDRLKKSGYPVDGVVLDLYWYGKETDMGRLEWDKQQWPDHRAMIDSLRKENVNLVIISQPYINKIGAIDNYNLLNESSMLTKDSSGNTHDVTTWVGEAGMFDVSNPDTRNWLADRYKSLTADGIAGWWGDLGEPEVHPQTIMHANGLTAEQYHNVYGNEWSKIIYDMLRADFPNQRPMLMMRGGTAGLQRYSVFPWSTDVSRSWGGLQAQINIMLNSGLSGLGYMSSDIGGFAVDPEHPTDAELYVRWLQMGVFTPILRTHAQQQPEPYNYPEYEDICRRFIKMRYQWIPYNYTLAYENATMGYPLARPFNFHNEVSIELENCNDQYMWGDNLLVAPILNAGQQSRSVVFPQGTWIDWNNPQVRYEGEKSAVVKAPIDVLPMFVRAGSFIPQYELSIENTASYDLGFLTMRYYPSEEETVYTLFDDNHTTTDADDYMLTQFVGSQSEDGSVEITVSSDERRDWMPQARLYRFEIIDCDKPDTISLTDDSEVSIRLRQAVEPKENQWTYDAAKRKVTIVVPIAFGTQATINVNI